MSISPSQSPRQQSDTESASLSRSYSLDSGKKKEEKKDWIKIGAIVALVVGALLIVLAGACAFDLIPIEFLNGGIGVAATLMVGGWIVAPAAYTLFQRIKNPPA